MRNDYCTLRQAVVFVVLAAFPLFYFFDLLGSSTRETSNEIRATINIENQFLHTRQPKFLVHFTEWPKTIINKHSNPKIGEVVSIDNEVSIDNQVPIIWQNPGDPASNKEFQVLPTGPDKVTVSSKPDNIISSGNAPASNNNLNTDDTAIDSASKIDSASDTDSANSASAKESQTVSAPSGTRTVTMTVNYDEQASSTEESGETRNESVSEDVLRKPDRAQSIRGPVSLEMQVIISDGEKKRKAKPVQLSGKLKKAIESIDKRVGVAGSQEDLKAYIASKCLEPGLNRVENRTLPLRPRMVYFNTEHQLLYVANPKCGSTSFKKYLLKLGGDERTYDEMTNVHNPEENPLLRSLWDESAEFQERALRDYYKVTFVRNPLVRLVSGYRNKIVRVPRDHYITIIQEIIQRNYGVEEAIHWLPRNKYRPSFQQFVEYLLDSNNVMDNAHWAPYSDNIGLCTVQFDLIGQLETANQHIEEMKRKVPSLQDIPFPMSRTELSRDGYSSEELTTLAFSNLTDILVEKVYKLYEKEIQLLGYSVFGEEKFPFINLTDVTVEEGEGE